MEPSQIRETGVFDGLPIEEMKQELRSGLAAVDPNHGIMIALLWLKSVLEEAFSVVALPRWRNPAVIGHDTGTDATQTVWMVPSSSH